MKPPETLALEIGSSRTVRVAHDCLVLLAAVGLLTAAAQPRAVGWSLLALTIAWAVSRWRLSRAGLNGSLQLRRDGRATLFETTGSSEVCLLDCWLSPWICVLRLRDVTSGLECRALLCRSRNDARAWRQLRVRLRSGQGGEGPERW